MEGSGGGTRPGVVGGCSPSFERGMSCISNGADTDGTICHGRERRKLSVERLLRSSSLDGFTCVTAVHIECETKNQCLLFYDVLD